MPRYYKDKIYDPDTRSYIAGHFKGQLEKELDEKSAHDYYVNENGDVWYSKSQFTEMHNRSEAIQGAFDRMYVRALAGRDKI